MKRDLISVIIPVYNVAAYLEKCVHSIIAQTYRNLEIVLVDDGSTDGSGELCDTLAQTDVRIRVIHKPNGGLSDARNAGIDVARGEFFSFVDSDDYLDEDAIACMYNAAMDSGSEIAVCNIVRFYEDGTAEPFYAPVDRYAVYEGIDRYFTLRQPSVCNKLFCSALFKDIRFPKGRFYEDTFVYHELLYRANRIAMTGRDGYWYLERKGSILGRPKYTERYFDFVEAVWHRATFLMEKQVQPYGYEACLSLYAAMSNAEKNIAHTQDNKRLFIHAREQYRFAYHQLLKKEARTGMKQKIRLVLLRWLPGLHSRVYK